MNKFLFVLVLIILFVYSFKFIINHENMSTAYGLSCDDGVNAIKTDIEVRKEILNQIGIDTNYYIHNSGDLELSGDPFGDTKYRRVGTKTKNKCYGEMKHIETGINGTLTDIMSAAECEQISYELDNISFDANYFSRSNNDKSKHPYGCLIVKNGTKMAYNDDKKNKLESSNKKKTVCRFSKNKETNDLEESNMITGMFPEYVDIKTYNGKFKEKLTRKGLLDELDGFLKTVYFKDPISESTKYGVNYLRDGCGIETYD